MNNQRPFLPSISSLLSSRPTHHPITDDNGFIDLTGDSSPPQPYNMSLRRQPSTRPEQSNPQPKRRRIIVGSESPSLSGVRTSQSHSQQVDLTTGGSHE